MLENDFAALCRIAHCLEFCTISLSNVCFWKKIDAWCSGWDGYKNLLLWVAEALCLVAVHNFRLPVHYVLNWNFMIVDQFWSLINFNSSKIWWNSNAFNLFVKMPNGDCFVWVRRKWSPMLILLVLWFNPRILGLHNLTPKCS